MDNSPSIRPVPTFFDDSVFLSKKARSSTPCKKKVPPRPPCKSFSSASGIFPPSKAQAISFKESDFSKLSKTYDETRSESYFQQCFVVEKKLGSGSYGDVYKCLSKEDGKYYAVKKSRERYRGKGDREQRLQEVARHEQLPKHDNLVRFYKAWEENQYLYIQTELCQCSLSEFAEQNHDITEKVIWNFLADMLSAIKHLHDRDLIHLDIKPENIFISRDGVFKLGDFGLVVGASEIDRNEVTEGDPKYLAKELMQGIFTKAADIFSLGITTLELACDLELPSRGEGWHLLRDGRMPEAFFNKLSGDLRRIILAMMQPDYRTRFTLDQLLSETRVWRVRQKRRAINKIRQGARFTGEMVLSLIMFVLKYLYILQIFELLSQQVRSFFGGPRNGDDRDLSRTPPHSSGITAKDWDQSFSDEEVFNSLMISPITDTPYQHNNDSFSHRFITPSGNNLLDSVRSRSRQLMSAFSTGTPVRWRQRGALSDICSTPQATPLHSSAIHSFNDRTSFADLSDDDDNIVTNSMGPKNLLNIFEEMEKEDED